MRDDVLAYLRCPLCSGALTRAGATVRCPAGHAYDVARQGYVNLTTGQAPHTADTPAMVAARAEFLAAGHYDFISAALAQTARSAYPGGLVVDAGAGTGRHLAAVLDARPDGLGLALDAAKPAVRRAVRAHPRAGAVVADTWTGLPLAGGTVGLLLNVFAPRSPAEFARVLHPDGALLLVAPAADHLAELVGALDLLRVDPAKPERIAAGLRGHFGVRRSTEHRRALRLRRAEVHALVAMGPSAWHADPGALASRIAALPEPVAVTAAVTLVEAHPTSGHVDRSTSSQPPGASWTGP